MSNIKLLKNNHSKLCDWLIILALLISIAAFGGIIIPHHQCVPGYTKDSNGNFICGESKDPELSYPVKSASVSTGLLMVVSFVPYFATIFINLSILSWNDQMFKWKKAMKKVEILSRMGLFCGFSTVALTTLIKVCVGRPRPNFYALNDANVYSERDFNESRMSFPSGHSSLSFSMLFLLTLNFYHSMRYAQEKRQRNLHVSMDNVHCYFFLQLWWMLRRYLLLSILMVFAPTYVAIYVACTRVTDYWHHYGDIAVGSLLGIGIAILSFMLYKDQLDGQYTKAMYDRPDNTLIQRQSDNKQVDAIMEQPINSKMNIV